MIINFILRNHFISITQFTSCYLLRSVKLTDRILFYRNIYTIVCKKLDTHKQGIVNLGTLLIHH
jgi:hypothetical protein